jgi:ankyrin repeat protein
VDVFTAVAQGDDDELATALTADPALAAAVDDAGVSLVRWALYLGRRDLAARILEAEPPLDVFDSTAVGDVERLSEVLAADPSLASSRSGDGFTALHFAAFLGTEACARALLDAGADPAARATGTMDVQPLHSAAAARNVGVARLLLAAGAPVDATQTGAFTALHEAANNGDEPFVDLLLAAGADPGRTTDGGQTASDLASASGHPDLAARLRS